MIKITRITKEKKQLYTVHFDNGTKLLVSEDSLVKHQLLKDQELTETQLKELQAGVNYDRGVRFALNYVSYQLRSEKEVRQYLKEKEIGSADITKVIDHLKDLRVLDDKVYAESYIRTQMRLSDKGPQTVRQQLRQKGIEETLITDALFLYDTDTQVQVAVTAAEKALRRMRNKSHQEMMQKVRMTLMQKGFSSEVISLALEELAVEKDEDTEWESLCHEGERLVRRHGRLPFAKRKQKITQGLYQKGFNFDLIQQFIAEELTTDDE